MVITAEIAKKICEHLVDNVLTHADISMKFNVPQHVVSDIACGRSWRKVSDNYPTEQLRRIALWRV